MSLKLTTMFSKSNLEDGPAWDTLALPVVAGAGEGNLLNRGIDVGGVVKGESRGVDDGASGLLGNGNAVVRGSLLMDVGLGRDLYMDVGFSRDLLVNVSSTAWCSISCNDNGLSSSTGGSQGGVIGGEKLSLGCVHFGGVDQELGGGGGQADED